MVPDKLSLDAQTYSEQATRDFAKEAADLTAKLEAKEQQVKMTGNVSSVSLKALCNDEYVGKRDSQKVT